MYAPAWILHVTSGTRPKQGWDVTDLNKGTLKEKRPGTETAWERYLYEGSTL